jgi:hypothetical protein
MTRSCVSPLRRKKRAPRPERSSPSRMALPRLSSRSRSRSPSRSLSHRLVSCQRPRG